MKIRKIAWILLLSFLLIGCNRPDAEPIVVSVHEPPSETVIDDPVPKGEPSDIDPGLLNYRDWLIMNPGDKSPDDVVLDQLVFSQQYDDGYVIEAVSSPGMWPTGIIKDTIPEYTGSGYLYELFVTHPNMSYRFDDIQGFVVGIYEYDMADVTKYIELLDGFTRDEEKENMLLETYPSELSTLSSLRFFNKDDCSLLIMLAEDNKGEFLQFNVTFNRDDYILDTNTIEPTKLQNVVEYAKSNSHPVSDSLKLDEKLEPEIDDLGRQVDVIIHPSKWPKEYWRS